MYEEVKGGGNKENYNEQSISPDKASFDELKLETLVLPQIKTNS